MPFPDTVSSLMPWRPVVAALALALAVAAPAAARAQDVLSLQFNQQVTSAESAEGSLTLSNLNQRVNRWYLLTRVDRDGGRHAVHLENPDPHDQLFALAQGGFLVLAHGRAERCPIDGPDGLLTPHPGPRFPICNGRIWARAVTHGGQSTQEALIDGIRESLPGSEMLINFYKNTIAVGAEAEQADYAGAARAERAPPAAPPAASMAPPYAGRGIAPRGLGIALADGTAGPLALGAWYAAAAQPGVFVSMMTPEAVPGPRDTSPWANSAAYLLAFDLAEYEVEYHVGAVHPGTGWSSRPHVVHTGGGPDGFATVSPLVRVGAVAPWDRSRVAAVFTGGYKREHGAFRGGGMAVQNNGTHYGFVEAGVQLSSLKDGLATMWTTTDGTFGMVTWRQVDPVALASVVSARQNGVPILERSPTGGPGVPGPLVHDEVRGNWSGNNDGNLRSLRAGACLLERPQGRWLVYGYFTDAVPDTLARIFAAYGCTYAMHLDMNLPVLTYAAVIEAKPDGHLAAQPLNRSMGDSQPRFVTGNDARDFFAILKKPHA